MNHWCKSLSAVLAATGIVVANPLKDQYFQQSDQIKSPQWKKDKVRLLVERWKTVTGTPGVSVAVSVDGQLVHEAGYGRSDVENNQKCHGQTVMRIASISKPIAAVIAAKLMETNKLELDKSIYEYLPEFPKKTYDGKVVDITIRQLLSHRGGIRHYHKLPKDKENDPKYIDSIYSSYGNLDKSNEYLYRTPYHSTNEALSMFKEDELVAKPGTFNYTTHGFTLLASCLEKVAGKEYKVMVKELFVELGMSTSRIDQNEPIIKDRARFYRRNAKHELVNVPEVDVSYKFAGGGILSTVKDLAKFGNAVLASYQGVPHSLLQSTTVTQLWAPQKSDPKDDLSKFKHSYTLGWFYCPKIEVKAGTVTNRTGFWYHTGAATGASSVLLVKPKPTPPSNSTVQGVSVAILANCQEVGASITDLATSISEVFVDY